MHCLLLHIQFNLNIFENIQQKKVYCKYLVVILCLEALRNEPSLEKKKYDRRYSVVDVYNISSAIRQVFSFRNNPR